MKKSTKDPQANPVNSVENEELDVLIEKLSGELELAREKERRAVADYQNLVRRNREEKVRIAKFAALDLIETIIDPLSHLSLAAVQINDQGLNMVISQLWMKLNEAGLEEINPVGQSFDVNTMEAVADPSQGKPGVIIDEHEEDKQTVIKVVAKGFKLNGEVIRHAKVIVS
jgi:molecular chaperone GrpE